MAVADLLSRVVGMRRETETKRRMSYAELVDRLARGEEPTNGDVNDVLDATGIDVEQLAGDVKRKAQRLADTALLETESGVLDELRTLRAEAEQINAECKEKLETIRSKYREKLAAVNAKIADNDQRREAIATARQRLAKTADESLHERRTELTRQIARISEYPDFPDGNFPSRDINRDHGLLGDLRVDHARHVRAAEELRAEAAGVRGSRTAEKRADMLAEAEGHEHKADRIAGDIAKQQARLAELLAERARIDARVLEAE
jgi:hypothetical protein